MKWQCIWSICVLDLQNAWSSFSVCKTIICIVCAKTTFNLFKYFSLVYRWPAISVVLHENCSTCFTMYIFHSISKVFFHNVLNVVKECFQFMVLLVCCCFPFSLWNRLNCVQCVRTIYAPTYIPSKRRRKNKKKIVMIFFLQCMLLRCCKDNGSYIKKELEPLNEMEQNVNCGI